MHWVQEFTAIRRLPNLRNILSTEPLHSFEWIPCLTGACDIVSKYNGLVFIIKKIISTNEFIPLTTKKSFYPPIVFICIVFCRHAQLADLVQCTVFLLLYIRAFFYFIKWILESSLPANCRKLKVLPLPTAKNKKMKKVQYSLHFIMDICDRQAKVDDISAIIIYKGVTHLGFQVKFAPFTYLKPPRLSVQH